MMKNTLKMYIFVAQFWNHKYTKKYIFKVFFIIFFLYFKNTTKIQVKCNIEKI